MEQSNTVKILGVIASIITISMFLAGYWGLLDQKPESTPASTSLPTYTASIDVPHTSEVTQTVSQTSTLTADLKEIFTNSIGMEFVLIPTGEFEMGSPEHEENRESNEGPVRYVKIKKAFYMGRYEVTQKEWREVMGNNPPYFWDNNLPADMVSWNNVQEFIRKLNEREGMCRYRLPSEAEWEYACRAGTTTRYSFGDSESRLDDYAWYENNSDNKVHPVGLKLPNSYGLYDMHGNVWEWVQDGWHNYYGAPTDGSALECEDESYRVLRGGSWGGNAGYCRSAFRNAYIPNAINNNDGFRLLAEI
jgi:formylglycine-generating enzyme required for sulfatase activity